MPTRVIIAMLVALSIPLTAACTQDVNSELMEAAEDGEAERVKTLVAARLVLFTSHGRQ